VHYRAKTSILGFNEYIKKMEQPIRSYQDLIVWQKSTQLATIILTFVDTFPPYKHSALIDQISRAAVSIPSNIAEGRQRSTRKDFIRYLRIAFGSASELQTQLLIARKIPSMQELNYEQLDSLLTQTMKMLNAMIIKLKIHQRS